MGDVRIKLRDAIARLEAPDLRSRIVDAATREDLDGVPPAVETNRSKHRWPIIVASFTLFAAAASMFALAVLPRHDRGTGRMQGETEFFRASYPSRWSFIAPRSTRIGDGMMVAQFTNFDADEPLCTDPGDTIPPDGALLRITVWTELPWESNLMLPTFEPALEPPPMRPGTNVGRFIDDCGADRSLYSMFFGPDGHLLSAHALVGRDASPGVLTQLDTILRTLAPTGHAPIVVAGIESEIALARGSTPATGQWILALRHDPQGERSLWFRSEDAGSGIYLDPQRRVSWGITSVSSGLVVFGVGPRETATVSVALESGEIRNGLTLTSDQLPDHVIFWVKPIAGELTMEGTMGPFEELTIDDAAGKQVARVPLP